MIVSAESSLSIVLTPPESVNRAAPKEHPRHARKRSNSDPGSGNFLQVPKRSSKIASVAAAKTSISSRVASDSARKPHSKEKSDLDSADVRAKKVHEVSRPYTAPSPTRTLQTQEVTKDPVKEVGDQFSELSLDALFPPRISRFQKFYNVDFTENPEALSEVLRMANEDFGNVPHDLKLLLQNAGRSIKTLSLHNVDCTSEKMKNTSTYFPKVECIQLNRCRLSPKGFSVLSKFSELRQLELHNSCITDRLLSELKSSKKLTYLHLQTCNQITIDALIDILKAKPMSMKIDFCKNIDSLEFQKALLQLSSQSDGPLRLKGQETSETDEAHRARMVFSKVRKTNQHHLVKN